MRRPRSVVSPRRQIPPHRHCHCHDWAPGSEGQAWHKDYPIGGHPRCHRSRWALLFYYPQDVSDDMGPTAVQSSSQYYMDPRSGMPEVALAVEAGTVVIAHYDIWHRATANTGDRTRYMLKFLFARRRDPTVPAWDARTAAWTPPPGDHRTLWQHMWHWHRGEAKPAPAPEDPGIIATHIAALGDPDPLARRHAADDLGTIRAPTAVPALAARLRDEDEAVRLNAAYALGSAGEDWVATLLASLREEALADIDLTEAKTADNGHGTNPTAPAASHALAVSGELALEGLQQALRDEEWYVRACAADALANMGAAARPALAALTAATEDPHWWVRRNAIEALRRGGEFPPGAAECVSRALSDDDYRVRRNAAMAMRDVPAAAEESVAALRTMLRDENRYNRFYSLEALRRLSKTHEAAELALYDELMTARWCSLTIPGSLY